MEWQHTYSKFQTEVACTIQDEQIKEKNEWIWIDEWGVCVCIRMCVC